MVKQTLKEGARGKTPSGIGASNGETVPARFDKMNTISTLETHMLNTCPFGLIQSSGIKDKSTTMSIIFLPNKGWKVQEKEKMCSH